MPAVSGPKAAGVPSESEGVAGTDPPQGELTGTTSVTVTLNVFGAEGLPEASLATQVTVVVPTAKFEPEPGSHLTAALGSRLSVAVGSVNDTAVPVGPGLVVEMSAGTGPSTGATVSGTNAPEATAEP